MSVAARKRLLVIDDDVEFSDEIKELLESEGHDVQVAYDGLSGIEALGSSRFDLVFLDFRMPGVGGLDVLRFSKTRRPDVKVIVITGRPMSAKGSICEIASEVVEEGILATANCVMGKPFDIGKFLSKVRNFLS
jgi:two-component system, NtrC family, nitrogen regulation response regulator NtrX